MHCNYSTCNSLYCLLIQNRYQVSSYTFMSSYLYVSTILCNLCMYHNRQAKTNAGFFKQFSYVNCLRSGTDIIIRRLILWTYLAASIGCRCAKWIVVPYTVPYYISSTVHIIVAIDRGTYKWTKSSQLRSKLRSQWLFM